MEAKKKKGFSFDGIVVLFILLLLVTAMTYVVPAGQYARIEVDGRTIVDPNSFAFVAQSPVGFFDFFKSISLGLQGASSLIFMIFLIGGAIRIFDGSGAIAGAIMALRNRWGEEKSPLILSAIVIFFGCLGAFPGMLEASIPFAPLCMHICYTLGYDALMGISISLVPIVFGWSAGVTNPWTTGIAQNLAQLPLFSGFEYRLICLVVFMALNIAFVVWYAKRLKKDPKNSLVADLDTGHMHASVKAPEFGTRQLLVLLTLAATIVIIVYGSLKMKWGMTEMSGAYLIGSIIGGIIAGYDANKIASELLEGGKAMFVAAMAIGMARAVSVIMDQGSITDTIVRSLAGLLAGQSSYFNAVGMFVIQTIINFFIPSGSGQAVVTMPIMLPVADLIGLNRQIAILSFQFGDGISNLIYPTVGGLIAFLNYTKISFGTWMKFIVKFILVVMAVASILLLIAVAINFS
ncbi:MAG: TIGR00366 family protein [Tissierellia bacterium]|nr:TIGR00366 family protein [Tissierellia bacterium]